MATIENGELEGFPRKSGPVRVSKWKKKVVVATIGNQGTVRGEAQIVCSKKFKLLRHFFSPTREFIRIGFAAAEGRATDRAMKVNFPKAFKGEGTDVELDYSAIQLSEGPLSKPTEMRAESEGEKGVEITWKDGGDEEDMLMVLLYNERLNQAIIYTDAAKRRERRIVLAVAYEWKEMPFHVYAAFQNREKGLASDSVYLGSMTVKPTRGNAFDNARLYMARKNRPYKKGEPQDFDVKGISGKVGPVNFFTNQRGEVIVRANPKKREKPQTLGERQAVERFRMVSHFLYKMHEFVKIGYASKSDVTLPHSAAMSANLKRVVTGEWPEYKIDYMSVQLSEGSIEAPRIVENRRKGDTVVVRWDKEKRGEGRDEDRLLMGVYNPSCDEAVVRQTESRRREGEARIDLPASWKNQGCVIYMAFVGAEKGDGCSGTVAGENASEVHGTA